MVQLWNGSLSQALRGTILLCAMSHVRPFSLSMSGGRPSAVQVCTNRSCKKAGSQATLEMFRVIAPAEVEVIDSGCHGKCGLGPNVHTDPADQEYNGVLKPATVAAILEVC
ncbi:unnamed protein product [Choristocarpus tenellus]